MLKLFSRHKSDNPLKIKLINRLQKVSDQELIRWIDNIHTGLGKNISEIRKSLTNEDQALAYIADSHQGVVSLMAALEVLEERITKL